MAAIPFFGIHRIPPFKWHDRTFCSSSLLAFDTVILTKKKKKWGRGPGVPLFLKKKKAFDPPCFLTAGFLNGGTLVYMYYERCLQWSLNVEEKTLNE